MLDEQKTNVSIYCGATPEEGYLVGLNDTPLAERLQFFKWNDAMYVAGLLHDWILHKTFDKKWAKKWTV